MNAYPLALSIVMAYERAGETSAARLHLVAAIAEILEMSAHATRALKWLLKSDRARLEGAIHLARAAAEAERVRLEDGLAALGDVSSLTAEADQDTLAEWRNHIANWADLRDALDRALDRDGAGR